MSFSIQKFLKSILIREENTSTPKEIEILPGGTASTKTTVTGSQTSNQTITLPDATDTLVGKATTDTLTNKTFDADGTGNVLSNIDDGNIKAAAAIDATKIADGSVTNTEFQFINTVTSNVQTQLNARVLDTGDTMTGDLNMSGTQRVTNMADPSSAQDAATKAYVDSVAAGLDPKESVRVATTANLAFTYATSPSNGQFSSVGGSLSIDGVSLATGDRVLVKDQTDAKQNGIYSYDSTAQTLTRTTDMDGSPAAEVSAGNFTFTTQGTANAANGYVIIGNGILTLNTDNISWTSFSGGASGASRDLSNLLPTAINESLVPATDNSIALGSATKRYTATHTQEIRNTGADLTLNSTTGKLIVSATSIDLPAASTDPGSPGESDLYFNTGLDKFKVYDGTRWRQLATKDENNYILNGNAESSTTGWATYSDAAGTSPVDGTGGSPNVTFATSATTPLQGQNSFIFTKDAANRQGQGASYDFTIDNAGKAQLMQVSFDFLVDSGTFTASNGVTDSDVTVWLYDVTNTRLIQPTSFRLLSNSTSVPFQFVGNFQTNSDSTSYRLILHVTTTSASAYALKLDNINVSRAGMALGVDSTITDWFNNGPITIHATTTNPTKGTTNVDTLWTRRVGSNLEFRIEYRQTAAGSAGSGDYIFRLPSSFLIDSSKVTFYTNVEGGGGFTMPGAVGSFLSTDNSTALGGMIVPYDTTGFRLFGYDSGSANVVGNAAYGVGSTNMCYAVNGSFPIAGWSSQSLTADITTKPTVAASYTCISKTYSETTPINFDTKIFDTHNAVTPSATVWKFTAPISGIYQIMWQAADAGNGAIDLYKNGVFYARSNSVSGAGDIMIGNLPVSMVAGDYVDVRNFVAASATTVSTVGVNFFSATRISEPTSITTINTFENTSNVITNGDAEIGTLGWSTYQETDSVTFQDTGDTVTLNGHNLANGQTVSFTAIVTTTGISTNTLYYVVGATTNTFQLASTFGGAALALTTNGSGTMVRFNPKSGAAAGSPTVTLTRSTSSPLSGNASFIFSKDAANRMGQGASYAFTIDPATQSKLMQVSFDFLVSSGTFSAGTDLLNSDLTVWLYDVTNSQLIQPSTYKLYSNSSSVPFSFIGNFQTNASGTSYRLIIHTSNPSTSAFDLKIDNVNVSRTQYALSVSQQITDWQTYTPASTQGFGTVSAATFLWRRVGNDLQVMGRFTIGTRAASEARISFPNNLTSVSTLPTLTVVGDVVSNASTSVTYYTLVEPSVSHFTFGFNSATGGPLVKQNGNAFLADGGAFSFTGSVPIIGWNSQMISADITNQATVAASYFVSANFAASTTIPINYDTKEYDTHNAVTTSATAWKFTAPVRGKYRISGSGSSATGGQFAVLYKNGTAYKGCGSVATGGANSSGVIDVDVDLNAGDFIDIRPIAANTVTGNTLGATTSSPATNINIVKVSDVTTVVMVGGGKKIGFDYTTGNAVTFGVNDLHGHRAYAPTDAIITRIGLFLGHNAGAGSKITVGIYSQSGTGATGLPDLKLAQSAEYTTIANDGGLRFFDLNTSVFIRKDQPYWLAVHSNAGITVENAFNSPSAGGQKFRTVTYNATLPTTFGTPGGDAGAGVALSGW